MFMCVCVSRNAEGYLQTVPGRYLITDKVDLKVGSATEGVKMYYTRRKKSVIDIERGGKWV